MIEIPFLVILTNVTFYHKTYQPSTECQLTSRVSYISTGGFSAESSCSIKKPIPSVVTTRC